MFGKQMHLQVIILTAAQALFQTAVALVMTVGGLAGSQIASLPELATTPIATMFLGTTIALFPASAWMAKAGRRAGFVVGALLGVLGGFIAALGVSLKSLPVLALGTFLVGVYQAFAQFYRFAASEVADDEFRPRAISFVLSGGVVAALLGPSLGRFGGSLLGPLYVGSFLILSLVSAISATVLLFLNMPNKKTNHVELRNGRSWAQIVTQPAYLVALFGAATGYGVMVLAMTATPIAMVHHHHALSMSATVIQFHIMGMFLPSFFTGSLIARCGALRIMFFGVLLLTAHVLMSWSGTEFGSFAGALALLGVGWNFLFIGGTALLTTTYLPAEKSRAQATNDITIFAVGLASSFSAGGLLQTFGWQKLNALLLPWLGIAALTLAWLGIKSRRIDRDATLPKRKAAS